MKTTDQTIAAVIEIALRMTNSVPIFFIYYARYERWYDLMIYIYGWEDLEENRWVFSVCRFSRKRSIKDFMRIPFRQMF